MRFVCESCRAQYMINDDKVGPKGVKVRCRKCGYVITVKRTENGAAGKPQLNGAASAADSPPDNEEGMATQVMNQMGAPESTMDHEAGDATTPGLATTHSPNASTTPSLNQVGDDDPIGKNFLGADDDEIGAVFDQVLKTGPVVKDRLDEALAAERSEDDRQSTRVIDAETVAQLAKESGTSAPALEPVPDGNWFVAINEKQTGPLSLEKVKEHWDRGEIGPDSLCWREGFSDWIPLSEVKALAAVLAPKPPKPIVVPTATIPASQPAVMSVPVQSAFSAGGLMQTVQAEVQVPIAAAASSSVADREESGVWKPSAASALASLVKDEMDALAKPPPKAVPEPIEEVPSRGLLDLPGHEEKPAAAVAARPAPVAETQRAPTNPYLANPGATYSAPAITQYRPQSNRGLIIGVSVAVVAVLLLLVGVIIWVANKQPTVVAAPPVAQAPVAQAPVVPPPTAPANPPPAATAAANPANPPANATAPAANSAAPVNPAVAAANPPAANPPANAVAVPPAAKDPNPPAAVAPPVHHQPAQPAHVREPVAAREPVAETPRETKKAPAPAAEADDFESAFGTSKGSAKKEAPAAAPAAETKRSGGYVPPAPGAGSDVKDSLSTADVYEVAMANRAALLKCTEEQHKRDPATTGKLVMRWQILTSGKVSNVTVASEEFKGTYMAGCVGGLIKTWVFPRHKNQGEPINFPFKF